jgi:glycerol-3-phosphate O-acyltransferase
VLYSAVLSEYVAQLVAAAIDRYFTRRSLAHRPAAATCGAVSMTVAFSPADAAGAVQPVYIGCELMKATATDELTASPRKGIDLGALRGIPKVACNPAGGGELQRADHLGGVLAGTRQMDGRPVPNEKPNCWPTPSTLAQRINNITNRAADNPINLLALARCPPNAMGEATCARDRAVADAARRPAVFDRVTVTAHARQIIAHGERSMPNAPGIRSATCSAWR